MRFDLAGADDRELPLILGLMPVLAKHAINPDTFEETTLRPARRQRTLHRRQGRCRPTASPSSAIPNYWGRDLADQSRLWNFDEIRFDYYRDANSHFEAFKKGLYDVRAETDPGRWETAYDFPAVRDGRIVKETFPTGLPKACSGLVFNTRRPIFADVRVREAIGMLFDFEWLNHNFFFDRYQRTASYFEGSELSARGVPADARERALLAPFPDAVRADVMDGTWQPPVTDGSGRDRDSAQARARAAQGRRLRARRHRAAFSARADGRSPSKSSSPPGTRSGWRSPSRATSSAPASPRGCAWSTPCSTTGGDSAYDFDMIADTAGTSRSRPATSRRSTGARRRPMPTARATTWASRARRSTP